MPEHAPPWPMHRVQNCPRWTDEDGNVWTLKDLCPPPAGLAESHRVWLKGPHCVAKLNNGSWMVDSGAGPVRVAELLAREPDLTPEEAAKHADGGRGRFTFGAKKDRIGGDLRGLHNSDEGAAVLAGVDMVERRRDDTKLYSRAWRARNPWCCHGNLLARMMEDADFKRDVLSTPRRTEARGDAAVAFYGLRLQLKPGKRATPSELGSAAGAFYLLAQVADGLSHSTRAARLRGRAEVLACAPSVDWETAEFLLPPACADEEYESEEGECKTTQAALSTAPFTKGVEPRALWSHDGATGEACTSTACDDSGPAGGEGEAPAPPTSPEWHTVRVCSKCEREQPVDLRERDGGYRPDLSCIDCGGAFRYDRSRRDGSRKRPRRELLSREMFERWLEELAECGRVILHHAGPEGKRARQAAEKTGKRVRSINVYRVLAYLFDMSTESERNKPLGMGALAYVCGWVQEHGALLDCFTQARVYGLLFRAIYRYLFGEVDMSSE